MKPLPEAFSRPESKSRTAGVPMNATPSSSAFASATVFCIVSAAVLAAVVFLFGGAAIGADTATVTKERSTTTESTPSGSTTTTTTTRTYSKSDSPDVVYKSIDTSNRGYVLRSETERITGFGDAFDKADKNHSGRLTREEFNSAWAEYKSTK